MEILGLMCGLVIGCGFLHILFADEPIDIVRGITAIVAGGVVYLAIKWLGAS